MQVQITIQELEQAIKLGNHLKKLMVNEDFKALVLDHILVNEPVRLTKVLGDPSIRANQRAFDATVDELKALGLLDDNLRTIQQMGDAAEQKLNEYREAQAEGAFDDEEDEE